MIRLEVTKTVFMSPSSKKMIKKARSVEQIWNRFQTQHALCLDQIQNGSNNYLQFKPINPEDGHINFQDVNLEG